MFTHIGDDNVIQTNNIISIINLSVISSSTVMEEMLDTKKKRGNKKKAKSVVITDDIIYLSPLSVTTLKKRASMISTISKLEDYSDETNIDNL